MIRGGIPQGRRKSLYSEGFVAHVGRFKAGRKECCYKKDFTCTVHMLPTESCQNVGHCPGGIASTAPSVCHYFIDSFQRRVASDGIADASTDERLFFAVCRIEHPVLKQSQTIKALTRSHIDRFLLIYFQFRSTVCFSIDRAASSHAAENVCLLWW